MVQSSLPEHNFPSNNKANEHILFLCPSKALIHVLFEKFHILMLLSSEPLANNLSLIFTKQFIDELWSLKVHIYLLESGSLIFHKFIWLLLFPANILFFLNSNKHNILSSSFIDLLQVLESISQILIVKSSEPVAISPEFNSMIQEIIFSWPIQILLSNFVFFPKLSYFFFSHYILFPLLNLFKKIIKYLFFILTKK